MPGGGAGMLNTLKNYSFLVAVEGVGSPARCVSPSWGERLVAGQGFGGGGAKGCAFAPAVRWSVRGLRSLRRTAQPSGKVAGFVAVAVFVLWALRDSVLAPNGCSPASPKFCFISSHGASFVKRTTASRRESSRRQASASRGPCTGRGERQTAPARVPTCTTRRRGGRSAAPVGGRRGRRGEGARGRSL